MESLDNINWGKEGEKERQKRAKDLNKPENTGWKKINEILAIKAREKRELDLQLDLQKDKKRNQKNKK